MKHRNISIVWDFDGTLTPDDSTSKVFEHFLGKREIPKLWKWIQTVNGRKTKPSWERLLSSDAPTWMHILSIVAFNERTPLNIEFFQEIKHLVKLYKNTANFLKKIKAGIYFFILYFCLSCVPTIDVFSELTNNKIIL